MNKKKIPEKMVNLLILFILFVGLILIGSFIIQRVEAKRTQALVDDTSSKAITDNIKNANTDIDLADLLIEVDEDIDLSELNTTQFKRTIQSATYGWLTIDVINVSTAVTYGIGENVLKYFVGMYTTSDAPGTIGGNTALAAHSLNQGIASYCSYCYFDNIDDLVEGDIISLLWIDGVTYAYEVYAVYPNQAVDMDYAYQTIEEESLLTLVTCSDGNSDYRTFVMAKLKETF